MTYSIGMDIGIASVGWSAIFSKTGQIDDLGVRIFEARNSDANAERRGFRGGRRLARRKRTRLNDAKKYLIERGFELDHELDHKCPYEMRVKGLSEVLTKSEIYKVVTHIIKKRGISYLDESDEEVKSNGKDYAEQIIKNAALQKEMTPGQIQLERLQEKGRVRSGINQTGTYQLNIFTVDAYAKELKQILEQQAQYYPEIDENFIQFFVKKGTAEEAGLIYRKRPYYHGPGNANNPSNYGRWATYSQDGYPAENIFDKLIGTDIKGKRRASSVSVAAQKFNLLNDLNNLRLPRDNEKVTQTEKLEIIHMLMHDEISNFGPKNIAAYFNFKVEEIKGWRINKSDKPEIHSMKAYRRWRKIFEDNGVCLADIDENILDIIAMIVTLNTEKDAIVRTLNVELPQLDPHLSEIVINYYTELRKHDSNSTWHSFSLDSLKLLIPELIHTSEEQNTILERLGLKFDLKNKYADLSYIPVEEVLKEIYNPTVAKSVRQSIKVLNTLIARYGKENISHITIEMPREKNEDDQKKIINEIQKTNEARHKASREYYMAAAGWDEQRFENELRKPSFAKKLYYYYEQDGKCAYSGKTIQYSDLLTGATEIDHIIPLSISLDDSLNNKVLVLSAANQEKGQRTPLQAFDEGAKLGQDKAQFIAWVKDNKRLDKNKKKWLLFEDNIYDPQIQKRFVARNLNDTRYSSRVVLNAVQSFFSGSQTKVKVITGTFTHTLRKKWGENLEKNRETHHHHAIDATLCAVAPFVHITPYEYRFIEANQSHHMVDRETGEIIPYSDYKKMKFNERRSFIPKWPDFIERLSPSQLYPRIKFSHQVNKKWNRKISDATLYSTREQKLTKMSKGKVVETTETMILGKIKNIYTYEGYQAYEKHKDALLIRELDPQSFEILEKIVQEFPAYRENEQEDGKIKRVNESPFKLYIEANDISGIQKYAKRGNGPIIRSLKYYDKKLGSHINITKDEQGNPVDLTANQKKVVLLSLNPWRTDVYYNAKEDLYKLVGIKYNHLKFSNGTYGIPLETYDVLKKNEGVVPEDHFCFSLYKKDRLSIEFGEEKVEGLYHSRTNSNLNYFEMKPIDKSKWGSKELLPVFGYMATSGQFIKGLKKGMKIRKIYTDILGKKYYIVQEGLKDILDK